MVNFLRFDFSPVTKRRLTRFRANRRGYWSLWIFLLLFCFSLGAELVVNDQPLLIHFQGKFYIPVFVTYSETDFGGEFATAADYRDPYLTDLVKNNGGWIIWPPIRSKPG